MSCGIKRWVWVWAVWLGVAVAVAAEESVPADTRAALSEWVETHQLTSRTAADWARDKDVMEQIAAMYERELKTLAAQGARVETNGVAMEAQRASAVAARERFDAAFEVARRRLDALEGQVRALKPVFPPALLATVDPLLARLPSGPGATNVPPVLRMQTLITLLNEVDKFHRSVAVVEETRKGPDGREVAVSVLYAGLGQAWFTDAKAGFAGFGVPTAEGWEWTVRNEIGAAVERCLRMYRNEAPATFVALPVHVR